MKHLQHIAQDEDAGRGEGEMAAAVNVEWGGLTVARRYETCDGRTSRKIFLREMGET
jgi:hypothetical protein